MKVDSRHPSVLGSPSYKWQGIWVRNKRSGMVGYIAYVERPRNRPAILWIIYPSRPVNKELRQHSAGSAYVREVKRLRMKRKWFAYPFQG